MPGKTETNGQTLSFPLTPYSLANLAYKTALISFSVSAITQPFQAVLTGFQINAPIGLNGGAFRSLYRGFLPHAIAGQKRGAVSVTAKQTTRETIEEEEMEISASRQNWVGPIVYSQIEIAKCLAGTVLFSQADLLISNALGNKAKLENAGIITKANFNWSFVNYAKLTGVNWGSRSVTGLINFAALGLVGDYISSFYKFDNNLYNKLAGGATAGVFATILTTIPNSYADRKTLASRMDNGHLLTVSPFTMFGKMKAHVQTVGIQDAFTQFVKINFLKEVAIRAPMSALTFAIIFGGDHLLGNEPLKKVWPKFEEIDAEPTDDHPSKRM